MRGLHPSLSPSSRGLTCLGQSRRGHKGKPGLWWQSRAGKAVRNSNPARQVLEAQQDPRNPLCSPSSKVPQYSPLLVRSWNGREAERLGPAQL